MRRPATIASPAAIRGLRACARALLGLAVVALAIDVPALDVLLVLDARALAQGHAAVRGGAVLHVVDAHLTAIEAGGLARGQAAVGGAGADAVLLTLLAVIDHRRVGLGVGKA